MKLHSALFFAIWLSLLLVATSRDVRSQNAHDMLDSKERTVEENATEESNREDENPGESDREEEQQNRNESKPEERDVLTLTSLNKFMDKHDQKADLMNLGKTTFESIGSFAKIDYSLSAEEIAWAVADAVVPIISAALVFVPVVGVLLSGLFSGLWGVVSAIWGPKKENPMEKMIEDLAKKFDKKLDTTLSNVINLAIRGEITRNVYICDKYNYTYQIYAGKFKNKKNLKPAQANNLKIYLNDCDNFLKDTAEAFVYDDYAHVLWVAGAITTSVRLGFLAELIKNGRYMGLTDEIMAMYVQEMKKDTHRQFVYHSKGLENVYSRTYNNTKFDKNANYLKKVTAMETASCTFQNQFFYFNRELYPNGMPEVLNNTDNLATIHMKDHFNKTEFKITKYKHLQIFFNVTDKNFPGKLPKRDHRKNPHYYDNDPYFAMEFMNCILGPTYLKVPSTLWLHFHFLPEKNKYSYEFRIMQLEKVKENVTGVVTYSGERILVPALFKLRDPEKESRQYGQEDMGKTCLAILQKPLGGYAARPTRKLIDIPAWAYWKKCPYAYRETYCERPDVCYFENSDVRICEKFVGIFPGRFRMYSAGIFNHADEDVSDLIQIDSPSVVYHTPHTSYGGYGVSNGFIMGLEVIIRPTIEEIPEVL